MDRAGDSRSDVCDMTGTEELDSSSVDAALLTLFPEGALNNTSTERTDVPDQNNNSGVGNTSTCQSDLWDGGKYRIGPPCGIVLSKPEAICGSGKVSRAGCSGTIDAGRSLWDSSNCMESTTGPDSQNLAPNTNLHGEEKPPLRTDRYTDGCTDSTITSHLKLLSGVELYRCSLCAIVLCDPFALEAHESIHDRVSPHNGMDRSKETSGRGRRFGCRFLRKADVSDHEHAVAGAYSPKEHHNGTDRFEQTSGKGLHYGRRSLRKADVSDPELAVAETLSMKEHHNGMDHSEQTSGRGCHYGLRSLRKADVSDLKHTVAEAYSTEEHLNGTERLEQTSGRGRHYNLRSLRKADVSDPEHPVAGTCSTKVHHNATDCLEQTSGRGGKCGRHALRGAGVSDPEHPLAGTYSTKEHHNGMDRSEQTSGRGRLCTFCQKLCKSSSALRVHRRVHTNERPYQCNFCGRAFSQARSWRIHQTVHTGKEDHTCRYCARAFTGPRALEDHEQLHRWKGRKNQTEIVKEPHRTVTAGLIKSVCWSCRGAPIDQQIKEEQVNGGTNKKMIKGQPYRCNVCNRSFLHIPSPYVLTESHLGTKSQQFCRNYPQAFIQSDLLTNPELDNNTDELDHTDGYRCTLCMDIFRELGALKVHFLIHSGESTHTHQGKVRLKNHKVIHSRRSNHPGKIGKEAFIGVSRLRIYERCLAAQRPFLCRECEKSFTSNATLKLHEMTHDSHRRFRCRVCSRAFSTSHTLKRHEKVHSAQGRRRSRFRDK